MKKSIETKKLLLDTVKVLLQTTADIKVKDITDTAFVNIAAVNYHFGDKDKLVDIAMNEIFVDFKYAINNFDASAFPTKDSAVDGFLEVIFSFVRCHKGFFGRLAISMRGEEYFCDEETTAIAVRQLVSLGLSGNTETLSAVFACTLANIVFAVLYFQTEISTTKQTIFTAEYYKKIKNLFE